MALLNSARKELQQPVVVKIGLARPIRCTCKNYIKVAKSYFKIFVVCHLFPWSIESISCEKMLVFVMQKVNGF